jgi:phospholipid/cholesterol/gamma-HCH transport system substrate-binding protein
VIRRTVKIQLLVFALLSVLGVVYVGFNYVGIHLTAGPYPVRLMLTESGGIFPNANVTERGVDVGRVAGMSLRKGGGVEVTLEINHGVKIPADVRATVANLSAVGEQYVDLEPQSDQAPYLRPGSVIPPERTTLPPDDATLLVDLDKLVNSVDRRQLATVIDELGKGFNDLGPSLQALIDNGNALTSAAIQSLPQELKLIDDGKTVLDTQNAMAAELKSWAASFASFSDQLRVSDPDLRGILDNGVGAAQQLQGLLTDNAPALPVLLGNLITANQIQAVRLPYVKATLELYPALVASGFYVTPATGPLTSAWSTTTPLRARRATRRPASGATTTTAPPAPTGEGRPTSTPTARTARRRATCGARATCHGRTTPR